MQITDKIYTVGVINPNLRIFDIIMETKYGTSYNAYLVKGEKIALVETVHSNYFEEYCANIKKVADFNNIEYVVLNHTEPDHSGSLEKLINLIPDIKVVATGPAHKYISSIINKEYNKIIAKDGDKIDLGGVTLEFKPSPFLHWPDSMFTFVPEEKTLFSCDMFGCHYCEPQVLNSKIRYKEDYDSSFVYYYQAIFSPFKKFVLDGIAKIENLDFNVICPSHGPVLVENIKEIINKYKELSTENKGDVKKATIVYASAYGYTEKMAMEIGKALKNQGIESEIYNVNHTELSVIAEAIEKNDYIFIGSPTINKDAVKPIWDVMSVIDAYKNKGKVCGIFGSFGWSGEAVPMLVARAKSLGLKVIDEGIKINFNPSEEELKMVCQYATL